MPKIMRFVWKIMPRDTGMPKSTEEQAMRVASEAPEVLQDKKEQEAHLAAYYNALDPKKLTLKEKEKFNAKMVEWYQKGDKVSMRMAGVSEDQNDPAKSDHGYLKRHALLTQSCVKFDQETRLKGTFQFPNDLADKKVGAGDIFPPEVKALYVEKGGKKIYCIRARSPRTGRIGFFEARALKEGRFEYVAVRNGHKFEVAKTGKADYRDILKEHLAVYKQGAMEGDDGEERYYDDAGKPLAGTPAAGHQTRRKAAQGAAQRRREGYRAGLAKSLGAPPPARSPAPRRQRRAVSRGARRAPRRTPRVTTRVPEARAINRGTMLIKGKEYPKRTRAYLESISSTPGDTAKWLVPITFLGKTVRVHALMAPAMAQLKHDMEKEGITYTIDPPPRGTQIHGLQTYNWRTIRIPGQPVRHPPSSIGENMSNHAWGAAFDLNPGRLPHGTPMIDRREMPGGRVPENPWEISEHHIINPDEERRTRLKIAKLAWNCGLRWGERFGTPDGMHFGLGVVTDLSEDLWTCDEAKSYLAKAKQMARRYAPNLYAEWGKPVGQRSKPGIAVAAAPAKAPTRAPRRAPASGRNEKIPKGSTARHKLGAGSIEVTHTIDARTIAAEHNKNAAIMKLELNGNQERNMDIFFRGFERNKRVYGQISKATGFPPIMIAIIHFREHSNMPTTCYLHNGDPLGKETRHVPKKVLFGKGQFVQAAIHALGGNISDNRGKPSNKYYQRLRRQLSMDENCTDVGKIMAMCEYFNGLGYRFKGRTSPYVLAGTNIDMGGLVQKDGGGINRVKDQRIGAGAALLAYKDRYGFPATRGGQAIA